ncbi:MAG TPA: alpha/beta fold hydrolase [Egibacteraceae bacterium]|nr:alpha/beta fold hydrolase [Egibacteraceae bacterium]
MAAPALPAPRPAQVAARVLWRAGSVAAAAAAAGAGATGWWASRALTTTPSTIRRWPVTVRAVGTDWVSLRGPGAALAGTWGLWWPGGYARVLPAPADEPETAERPLTPIEGRPHAGARAEMCAYAWPDRPDSLGLPWTDVLVGHPVGAAKAVGDQAGVAGRRAWLFGRPDNRDWVLFVHGRGSRRAQAFRALPSVVAAGWTGLAVTYRGAVEEGGGRNGMGAREWVDVEAAVRFARDAGADRIVLVGFSMGGAIVGELLHRSSLAPAVDGVVLEAPVLDWSLVLRHHARRMRLPRVVVPLTLAATHLRAGSDPRELDQLRRVDAWTAPVLLVHGTHDPVVPVASSDLLAEARPDLITYLRAPGAGHVSAWNADRDGYEAALTGFLTSLP